MAYQLGGIAGALAAQLIIMIIVLPPFIGSREKLAASQREDSAIG
jgi:hypothetical protein